MDKDIARGQAISTQKGLYAINRHMFGFGTPMHQQNGIGLHQISEGIPGVTVFYDDVRIVSKTFVRVQETVKGGFKMKRL